MTRDRREFILYGDDLKLEQFPENTRFLYANPPLPPAADPGAEIERALDNPVGAEPLGKQLNAQSRVTIAFDDPCRTLDFLFSQQNVRVDRQADILIFGIPNLSPYSAFSIFNPILLRGLVLGYYLGMFRERPLLKKGGVIVACNPGIEKFHPQHHPSYQYFWNHDLKHHQEPVACWNSLAERYAMAPEFLEKYRNGYAYHGAHVLINWFWSGLALDYVGKVILAGARQPRTAEKIGFTPAKNLTVALDMARKIAGRDAHIVYQAIPPLFACDPA